MKGKFKKLFRIILSNKKTLVLGLGIVIVLSLVPLHFTQANVFSDILGGIISLPVKSAALFISVPLILIALATGALYSILIIILGWLKTIILSVPVIPSEVDIVQAGWEITRNLANMGFILILVFIGLATILRIKEYEAKKLLPILIIVALLINFSPVIVGFVVDISNIITNFFLEKVSIQSIGEIWSIVGSYLLRTLGIMTQIGGVVDIIGSIIGTLVLGVVIICFFGYASWIYLIVMALLIVRIIALWILMILAPLAFLFYVLPAGRKLAREWWHNLFHWSIIAIPIGFFLFLSFKVLSYSSQVKSFFKATDLSGEVRGITFEWGFDFGDFVGTFADALGVMLVPLVSIVILHIGYKFSRRYMPAAANQIIGGIEKGFKMLAGAALVAATGGAAAGLAVKGLGGMAKGAKGLESALGRVPIAGKALKYGVGKPMSWTTRGIERAAVPPLLEYQAKTRKVSDKELEKIDKMSGSEAETYTEAKLIGLPKGLAVTQRVQYVARMTDKGIFEDTSRKFREKGKEAKEKIFIDENPHFQKEAHSIAKSLGDMSEEELVHSKLVGKTGDARTEAEKEIRKEIKETGGIIENRISKDDLTIEAGLKLKYIIKGEVDTDKAAALAKAKANLKAGEIEKFLSDTSATATYVKEEKPEDIKKMVDPKNFATRMGITLGNPRNLQRILDNFGMKVVKDMFEGAGGFNDATNTPEKLKRYARKENPRMARSLFTSPAYREIDFAGRNQMVNPRGQPTTNFRDFERTLRIEEILAEETRKKTKIPELHNLQRETEEISREIEKLRREGRPATEIKEAESRFSEAAGMLTELWDTEIENTPLEGKWEEISRLRGPFRGPTPKPPKKKPWRRPKKRPPPRRPF